MQSFSTDITQQIEQDVFIVDLYKNFDKEGNLILDDKGNNPIRFSKDFWEYFIKKFPKSAGMIFISPQYEANQDYLNLGDTSLSFFNVDIGKQMLFKQFLSTNPTKKEKGNYSFFVIPKDPTLYYVEKR